MMNQRTDTGNRPTSTIEAAFSHADEFDFIDLRLAFDGIAFSSSPISTSWYDGPWDDLPCEHLECSVHFSSVFCPFGDFVKFLEAIAIGVEECSFSWDPEGPDASFSWQRASHDGTGFLSVVWRSRNSFRYVVRIDGKLAVRALYGAFREFVESDAYDPVRYERMCFGEKAALTLEEEDFGRLPSELEKLDAKRASALLNAVTRGYDDREIRGPKRRYRLARFLGELGQEEFPESAEPEGFTMGFRLPSEWNTWPRERRFEEIQAIMGCEVGSWYGANLRQMRSSQLEDWLEMDNASLA